MTHGENSSGSVDRARKYSNMSLTINHNGKRWAVTRRLYVNPDVGEEVIEDSIIDPETGEVYVRRPYLSHDPEDLTFDPAKIRESARAMLRWVETPEENGRKTTNTLHAMYPELAEGAELPHGPLPRIKLRFAQGFAPWGIHLPEEDVVQRRRGTIRRAGWWIPYLFGSDEKGEYVEYYAAHRMTNDNHIRSYENGAEMLPAREYGRMVSRDPVEDAVWKREFEEEQKRIDAMLKAKGF
jgi:hypothetical protein